MPAPELVIFDCDGVLVDSEIIAARVEAEVLTKAGYEIDADELSERFAGLTFTDMLLRIEAETGLPFQASIIARTEELIDKRLAAEVRPIEGAGQAVASVTGPRCICSNSSTKRVKLSLTRAGLMPLFEGLIFSGLEIPSKRTKPAPDVFLYAAEKLEADPKQTFVIEDSVHGVAGAKAAGMRVIGFTGAAHSYPGHADRLTEAGAETVIRRWIEFPAVLAALSEWAEPL
jgi:HAD superfamily hydrolase (TIGR01509 family)